MSFITDTLFGSEPEQVGNAQSPGQAWLQQQLRPMMQQGIGAGMQGQGLYPTQQASARGYQAQGYDAPQAPYGSPSDYLGQYQDTSMNAMEQFWGGGGGGSAMGGWSGSGVGAGTEIATWAGRNAMQDYQNAMLPYAQMQNQASQYGAQAQNQAGMFGAGAQNQANMFNASAQNQAYGAPWNILSQYSGTYGSPIVQPGQEGLLGGLISGLGGGAGMMGGMMGMEAMFGGAGAAAGIGGVGAASPSLLATLGPMAAMSDIRLKKNVNKIGKYKGMDVIEFEYIWGGGRKTGLIAQQVKEIMPNAVGEIGGYLCVNYGMV